MLFKILLGLLASLGLVASSSDLAPSFTWSEDETSSDGTPFLIVNFPDGEIDAAILKRFNPIPMRPDESDQDIDNCIFEGFLEQESSVYVTVTGGCPFSNSFEIQFKSSLLSNFMFQVVNGEVRILQSPYQHQKNRFGKLLQRIKDIDVQVPEADQESFYSDKFDRATFPASGFVLKTAMYYDQTFKAKYITPTESVNALRRVAAQAQNLFYWPSLKTTIRLDVVKEQEITESIQADTTNLSLVGKYATDSTINENAFLSYQNNQAGTVGIAWVGTVCHPTLSYRTSVSEWYSSDMITGQIVAHEIGHNLGMSHDFIGSDPNAVRYDSLGNSCTKIGGVMDYYGTVTLWSTCSAEDFQNYYDARATNFCMATDGATTTTSSASTAAPTTMSITTTTKRTTTKKPRGK